jgi:hypothetical protein
VSSTGLNVGARASPSAAVEGTMLVFMLAGMLFLEDWHRITRMLLGLNPANVRWNSLPLGWVCLL